jgi:hypothetical protein
LVVVVDPPAGVDACAAPAQAISANTGARKRR